MSANEENLPQAANAPTAGDTPLNKDNLLQGSDSKMVISPISAKNILPTRLRKNRKVEYVFEEKEESDVEEEDPTYDPREDEPMQKPVVDSANVEDSSSAQERFESEVSFILEKVEERIAEKEAAVEEKEEETKAPAKKQMIQWMPPQLEDALLVYTNLAWSGIRRYFRKNKMLGYQLTLIFSLLFVVKGIRALAGRR